MAREVDDRVAEPCMHLVINMVRQGPALMLSYTSALLYVYVGECTLEHTASLRRARSCDGTAGAATSRDREPVSGEPENLVPWCPVWWLVSSWRTSSSESKLTTRVVANDAPVVVSVVDSQLAWQLCCRARCEIDEQLHDALRCEFTSLT